LCRRRAVLRQRPPRLPHLRRTVVTRLAVGLLHALMALSTLSGAVVWLVQARLNLAWELGFYGGVSLVTGAGLFAVAAAASLGAVHLAGAIGWLVRRVWGAHVLLALSVFYALVMP